MTAGNHFAISGSRVVTPEGEVAATIVVEGEKICCVIPRDDSPRLAGELKRLSIEGVEDFGDLVISPGVFDAHVHINEPGRSDWEGFETATNAAAAGGITTLIDMPLNSSPVTITADALELKKQSTEGKLRVDVGFYGGLIPENQTRISELVNGGVVGIKAFLCDSGLDEFPASGEAELRSALAALRGTGVPLLAHAEMVDLSLLPNTTQHRSYESYMSSRPERFELDAIELLIQLCREFETPVHIVHLAAAAALPLIRDARLEGLPLTVETCPHYLYFDARQIGDGETVYKCAPPIRGEANRLALIAAVKDGLIDSIGSDHSPCPPDLKSQDTGNFFDAWGGICGLQLSLPVAWTVGKSHDWDTALLAEKLSTRPAEIFGFGSCKGKIAAGYDADFCIWNPDEKFTVDGSKLLHRHATTPYHNRVLAGVVQQTYLRGSQVFNLAKDCPKPTGRILVRVDQSTSVSAMLNDLSPADLRTTLETCCAADNWGKRVASQRPFSNDAQLQAAVHDVWSKMAESDLLKAFAAHPRIGDVDSLRAKYANTKAIAGNEQAGVDSADESILQRLADANQLYFDKFGFIFIVCATGKSAAEMLEILESRLPNDRETELSNAAAEQLKITLLRLEKLA